MTVPGWFPSPRSDRTSAFLADDCSIPLPIANARYGRTLGDVACYGTLKAVASFASGALVRPDRQMEKVLAEIRAA